MASPGLAAHGALDKALTAAFVATRSRPVDDEVRRIGVEVEAAAARWAAEGWSSDSAGYHRRPPELDDEDVAFERLGRWPFEFETMSFASGFAPRADEPGSDRFSGHGDTVRAPVLRHGEGTDRPWLICLHGYAMGRVLPDFVAFRAMHLHRQHGLNVAIPVMPRHGQRAGAGHEELVSFDILQTVHGLSNAIWDVRRIIAWIRRRTDAPIGLCGMSLGGNLTGLVAGLEPVDLAVAGIPATDFHYLISQHAPRKLRQEMHRRGVLGDHAQTILQVVSPLAVTPMVTRDRLFIYAGIADRIAPHSQAEELWEHWQRPEIHWYRGGHVGFVWSPTVREFVDRALTTSEFVQATGP